MEVPFYNLDPLYAWVLALTVSLKMWPKHNAKNVTLTVQRAFKLVPNAQVVGLCQESTIF